MNQYQWEPGKGRRAAHTYRAARRNQDKAFARLSVNRRPNLQGPFPYVAPAATPFYWFAARSIRKCGREWRNMRVGERA